MNRLTHVDGLRAVAVLAVLFFHLGSTAFSGGFVGVDVFFVISGFVITRMILRDLDTGRFSFRVFYKNRFKRLYPAFIFTVLVCLAAGVLILPPSLLVDLGRSSFASITAWSNIYFWNASGYFDKAAELKPLLHTWTLSLEWQFYAIWPLFLFATPQRILPYAVATLSIMSALLCIVWPFDPTTPFYWMPFRIFEFGIGALVLLLPPPRRFFAETATVTGLALIVVAVFTFTDQTPFPSYNALTPAVGAALVIWGGASISGRTIGSPPMAFLGRCSYSTYLIHWPLIAFATIYTAQPLSTNEAIAVGALSLLGGAALYRLVEFPFWHGRLAERFPSIAAQLVAITLVLCGFATTGLWWRIAPEWRMRVPDASQFHVSHFGGAGYKTNELIRLGAPGAAVTFHIVGDSFAHQLASGLDLELTTRGMAADAYFDNGCPMLTGVTRLMSGLEDKSCTESISKMASLFRDGKAVVFAINWMGYRLLIGDQNGAPITFKDEAAYFAFLSNRLSDTRRSLHASKMVLLAPAPGTAPMRLSPFDCVTAPEYLGRPCLGAMSRNNQQSQASRFLINHASDVGDIAIDPYLYLCGPDECPTLGEGKLLYSDGSHLSVDGSRFLAPKLLSAILTALD